MESTQPSESRRTISWHWIVLGLLVTAHAAFGAWLTPFGKSIQETGKIVPYLMIGFLISQPLLFAFWAAFAPQRFCQRFLWSLLLCILVSYVEEIGALRHQKTGIGQGMLLDAILFVVGTILLLLFRRFSRWQFKQSTVEEPSADYQPHQFGIKHLLILTTIAALACGLFRTLLLMNSSLRWLPSVAQFAAFICIVLALVFPVLVIPGYTLASRGRVFALIFFTAILGGVCDLAAYFIAISSIPSPAANHYEEIIQPFLLVQLGAALSVLFTTLVMRWCGFRMVRERKTAS